MTIKHEVPLAAGNVVRLVSGGPKMAIEAPHEVKDGVVTAWVCTWCPRVDHGDGWGADIQEGEFVSATLVRVDDDDRLHSALADACTERDMLAARLKEVEAERDALKASAEGACEMAEQAGYGDDPSVVALRVLLAPKAVA